MATTLEQETSENPKLPKYTGTKRPEHDGERYPKPEENTEGEEERIRVYPYLPSKELVDAVNLAIILKRPLLIEGEPGCGKTELAGAVAYELGLPYQPWHVKSTSRAQDGLYTYDHLARLHDAQLAGSRNAQLAEDSGKKRSLGHSKYITYGPLGEAFRNERQTVVLIDEIDKADIDFPNDLLLELNKCRFKIKESGKVIEAKHRPIVFITSNHERELPNAFLRRCLFHYIKPPNIKQLETIIKKRFNKPNEDLVKQAVKRFYRLREEMRKDKGRFDKKVSTSELIDWFKVLKEHPHDEVLKKLEGQLPYPSVLLKNPEDHDRYL